VGQWHVEPIAYEATATYHSALEVALADWPCIKLNPERARRFAQATGTLAKTDHIDAMLLARMAATPPVSDLHEVLSKPNWPSSSMPATASCVIVRHSIIAKRTSPSRS